MTTNQLAEWRRLAEAATPGPWKACEREAESPTVTKADGEIYLMGMWPAHDAEDTRRVEIEMYDTLDFIAAAREAVPSLVTEVEKLRVLLNRACVLAEAANLVPGGMAEVAKLFRDAREALGVEN